MTEILVQIIFGWPAIITSILLSLAGVALRRPAFLVAAAVIGIPFAAYLTAASRLPALVLPLFQLGSVYALRLQKTSLAWLLNAPLIVVAILLGYAVLTQ